MPNDDKIALLNAAINEGCTVYLSTCLRTTSYSPKLVAGLRAKSIEPWKLGADGAVRAYSGWRKGRAVYVSVCMPNGVWLVKLTTKK